MNNANQLIINQFLEQALECEMLMKEFGEGSIGFNLANDCMELAFSEAIYLERGFPFSQCKYDEIQYKLDVIHSY